mgnify:FL=1
MVSHYGFIWVTRNRRCFLNCVVCWDIYQRKPIRRYSKLMHRKYIARTQVFEWHRRFQYWKKSLKDDSSRGMTFVTKVKDVGDSNRHVLVCDVCNVTCYSYDTVQQVLTEQLHIKKVSVQNSYTWRRSVYKTVTHEEGQCMMHISLTHAWLQAKARECVEEMSYPFKTALNVHSFESFQELSYSVHWKFLLLTLIGILKCLISGSTGIRTV